MEIKGRIIQNLGLQGGTSKSGKQWSKASILIETEGQYPKKILLDNMKNAEEFSKLPVGYVGIFHVEVESREFNERWYTSVNCWKWEPQQAQQPYQQPPQGYQQPYAPQGMQPYQPQAPQSPYPVAQPLPPAPDATQQSDDLPF